MVLHIDTHVPIPYPFPMMERGYSLVARASFEAKADAQRGMTRAQMDLYCRYIDAHLQAGGSLHVSHFSPRLHAIVTPVSSESLAEALMGEVLKYDEKHPLILMTEIPKGFEGYKDQIFNLSRPQDGPAPKINHIIYRELSDRNISMPWGRIFNRLSMAQQIDKIIYLTGAERPKDYDEQQRESLAIEIVNSFLAEHGPKALLKRYHQGRPVNVQDAPPFARRVWDKLDTHVTTLQNRIDSVLSKKRIAP